MNVLMVNASTFPWTETLSTNFSSPDPSAPLPPDAHAPLPTIIVVFCLFVLFASCTAFLAVCRPSAEAGLPDGGCGSAEALPCSPSLSSEPELKLWKRLGSVRRSLTSSFRRPPQRRPDRRASAPTPVPVPPHLSVPCLYDHATEI